MCITMSLHTQFHVYSCSDSLVTAIKLKAKYIFYATFILLSEGLQQYINKNFSIFQRCYHANVKIHIKCR
jgi:hypothetical protein